MTSILASVFISLLVLLVIGTPVGVALGIAALVGMSAGDMSFFMFVQRLYNTFDSFPLLAVPFFVLAGDIMQRGTLADSLLGFCRSLVGHITGGLSHISILSCLFYGALSGSAPATTAAVGGIMVPAMAEENYPKVYATAVNAAGGCLGVLIPPSVPLILYGSTVGCSISDLFIAGIVPGVLIGAVFMGMCYVYARMRHWGLKRTKNTASERAKAFWDARYALLVPVIVLGGIYGGIVTPTEASCLAVMYALFVETCITRSMTWRTFKTILYSSMRTTGAIFFVIATANALSIVLVYYNAHEVLCAFIMGISENPAVIILILTAIFVILGTFVETAVTILVVSPMLMPVVSAIGMHPVHFGLFMLVMLATGFLTPPVGLNLFVGASIANVSLSRLAVQCLPFCMAMILVGLVIAFVPALTTFML